MISSCVRGNRGIDCGGSSCLSGGLYSSCDIKYGRKRSGDRGGGGCGNEGGGGGGSMCHRFSFCLGVRTITLIAAAATATPEIELVLCASKQTDEN